MEPYVLSYKFRIYPNKTQQRLINRTLGCCRFVYNHFLAVRRDQWQANHRSVSYFETCKLLTDLKRQEETSWLKEADSMALQESLRNLDNAFQNFWKLHTGYPRFKSKHSHSQSYRTRNQKNGIRIVDKRIKLPKIGFVKIKQSRDCDGRILSATISRTASSKYFVSFCMEQDKENLVRPNAGGMEPQTCTGHLGRELVGVLSSVDIQNGTARWRAAQSRYVLSVEPDLLRLRLSKCPGKGFERPRMGLPRVRYASRQGCECGKEHPAQGFGRQIQSGVN